MSLLAQIFTWWNGQTLNTQVWTALNGSKVGEDEQGNVYYQKDGGKRRWVIYNGESEASRVSPEWHGWLHHATPRLDESRRYPWQLDHQPNMTGTAQAYRPSGSTLASGRRPKATGDYHAWTPGS